VPSNNARFFEGESSATRIYILANGAEVPDTLKETISRKTEPEPPPAGWVVLSLLRSGLPE